MILFLSAYPPRECGLASYSYHLLQALKEHFDSRSLSVQVCALDEEGAEKRLYPDDVRYTLQTSDANACQQMARLINGDKEVRAVCIQHRFGLWGGDRWGENIIHFLKELEKPLAVVMHNVLPEPEQAMLQVVNAISGRARLLITQTKYHADLLKKYYNVPESQIRIIAPGAPVVPPFTKEVLRKKYKLEGKLVLTSFGLLRRSKGIEHVLEALDSIRQHYPEVVYLILGQTHPAAARHEGERYRIQLKDFIFRRGLQKHIRFVNRQLEQQELQEYICLSDVYLHSSKASLNSLMLALSCGVQVVAEAAPVTEELLHNRAPITNLRDSTAIAEAVLLVVRQHDAQQKTAMAGVAEDNHPCTWPNIALAYQEVFTDLVPMHVHYKLPALKADHLYRLTTSVGLLNVDQQSNPLAEQGYFLKDNAQALVAALLWYRFEPAHELLLLMLMRRFLNVIRKCQQPDGTFVDKLDDQGDCLPGAAKRNSEECGMQALWALSGVISAHEQLPADMTALAQRLFAKALPNVAELSAPGALIFAIKALTQYNELHYNQAIVRIITQLADKLQQAFSASLTKEENKFTQINQENSSLLLPEALMLAWQVSGQATYKKAANKALYLLLRQLFVAAEAPTRDAVDLPFLSEERYSCGGSPQTICYTIMALNLFYQQTGDHIYLDKMFSAFSWFMGNNEVNQTLYNPATGGCYDGLKNEKVSRHQGGQSLVSYLLSRLMLEKHVLQLRSRPQVTPEPKVSGLAGVGVMPDRPSIASGQVKVLAN